VRSSSKDTRLLVVGVVAFLALLVYLAVAFATTHASTGALGPNGSPYFGSWLEHDSKLSHLPGYAKGAVALRVTPSGRGTYGALVPTLASDPPPGHRYVIGLWLRAARPGRVGIAIDEFSPGVDSVYVVNRTVPVTPRWRHFTFAGRIKGRWLGLGMYVSRLAEPGKRNSFDLRGLTAELRGSSRSRGRG
jgi:hypothetical protein